MTSLLSISIEIELAWGFHSMKNSSEMVAQVFSDGRKVETKTLEKLLEQCDQLNIPITFNIVGHLLLDECTGTHGGPYDQGWFDADPGTDVDTDPLYYAPDLAEMIDDAAVDHEIATHTFSHILFDTVDDEIANQEIKHAIEAHNEADLPRPTSLIPPLHKSPPVDVLLDNNIDTVRYPMDPVERRQYPIQSINVCKRMPTSRKIDMNNGLLWMSCDPWPSLTSAMLPTGQRQVPFPLSKVPITLRRRIHEWKLRQAVEYTITNESYLHLHSHLFNMSNKLQLASIQQFLQTLSESYDDKIDVLTMAEFRQRFNEEPKAVRQAAKNKSV
jgi:hypothetical protein